MGDITREDFRELRDEIRDNHRETRTDLRIIQQKQDLTNGRVNDLEVSGGQFEVRMNNIERWRADVSDTPISLQTGERKRPSKRDALWMSIGGGLGLAVVEFLKRLADWMQ